MGEEGEQIVVREGACVVGDEIAFALYINETEGFAIVQYDDGCLCEVNLDDIEFLDDGKGN